MDRKNIRAALSQLIMLGVVVFATPTLNSQQMQKGISVRLATTESALPIAAADEPNALIIAVTADGKTYFRINPVTPDALVSELTHSSHAQRLFIKADASAPYSSVEPAIDAARHAGFSDCIFLTEQYEMPGGTRIFPKGLEVPLKSSVKSKTPRVELLKATEDAPTLKINERTVPWQSLQNVLTTILGNQIERKILIKAEGTVPFEQVVHAIDVANSIGAEVVLAPQA